MFDGITPTKFGGYAVAEPMRLDHMHLHRGETLIHLSTLEMLGQHADVKQLIVREA